MASIEERKRGAVTSYVVQFYRNGRRFKISLDSGYKKRDAERVCLAVQSFVDAERMQEPLDRQTREFFKSAPSDLLKRFHSLGFGVASREMTVATLWKEFLAYCEGTLKPSTVKIRRIVYARFREYFPDDLRFDELRTDSLATFRAELAKLYAPTTVTTTVAVLRTFATWAIKRGYIAVNPFVYIPTSAKKNRSRDFHVPKEWAPQILSACPNQLWRTLFCLWRFAGLRRNEPLVLKRSSVDLDGCRLSVYAIKLRKRLDCRGNSRPRRSQLARTFRPYSGDVLFKDSS